MATGDQLVAKIEDTGHKTLDMDNQSIDCSVEEDVDEEAPTSTVSERSPTTAVEAGNTEANTITASQEFPATVVDEPSSESSTTQTGPDPLDPQDYATSSYTEISFGSNHDSDDGIDDDLFGPKEEVTALTSAIVDWTEKATSSLQNEDQLGQSLSENVEKSLKLSSPASMSISQSSTTIGLESEATEAKLDLALLNQLEESAQALKENINSVLRHISGTTQTLSGLTVECMHSYEKCLEDTADTVDANIKSMYQLMTQVDEINRSMTELTPLKEEVSQIKRLLDVLEKAVV